MEAVQNKGLEELVAAALAPDCLSDMGEDLPDNTLAVVVYHPSEQSMRGPMPSCSASLRVWVE